MYTYLWNTLYFLVDDNGHVLDKEAHGSDIQGHNVLFRNSMLWIINTKYMLPLDPCQQEFRLFSHLSKV